MDAVALKDFCFLFVDDFTFIFSLESFFVNCCYQVVYLFHTEVKKAINYPGSLGEASESGLMDKTIWRQ